jgi:MFS family permease
LGEYASSGLASVVVPPADPAQSLAPEPASPPAPRAPLLSRDFAALLVAQVGFGYAFSTFLVLPKFLVVALGASPREIGLVTAAHNGLAVVLVPLLGALVDRHGRRRFLTAGALLMAGASLGFTRVDSLGPAIYALRALQALAFAMAFAAGSALAVDEAPPGRVAQAIGIFGLTFLSMNAVAPGVAEEVSVRVGWPAAFALAALGATLCAALSLRLRERPAERSGEALLAGLLAVARRGSQLRVLVVIALVGVGFTAVFVFPQPFAEAHWIARLRAFFAAYAGVVISVRVAFGGLFDRVGARRAALAALLLYTTVPLLAFAIPVTGLALAGAGLGLAHGVLYPALNAVALSQAGPHERGRVMALYQGAFQLGGTVGPVALGLLAQRAGYGALFLTASGCLVVAFGVLAWTRARAGS